VYICKEKLSSLQCWTHGTSIYHIVVPLKHTELIEARFLSLKNKIFRAYYNLKNYPFKLTSQKFHAAKGI